MNDKDQKIHQDLIDKYNKLLVAAKKVKAENVVLLAQNDQSVSIVAGSEPIKSAKEVVDMYEERITRVIRLVKDPRQDPHSMSPRIANILRPAT